MDNGGLAGRKWIVHGRGWWWLKNLYFTTMPWWIPSGDIKLKLKQKWKMKSVLFNFEFLNMKFIELLKLLLLCRYRKRQAWLAFMSSSVNFKWLLTFELWVVKSTLMCHVFTLTSAETTPYHSCPILPLPFQPLTIL